MVEGLPIRFKLRDAKKDLGICSEISDVNASSQGVRMFESHRVVIGKDVIMSAVASGNDGWMWMAFLRLAEPLMQKVNQAATVVDEPVSDCMLMFADVPSFALEEDAERWDGMA